MGERERESVWDYPRPPRVERCDRRVRVVVEDIVVAESDRALRVLETSSPPTIYVPREDVRGEHLRRAEGKTVCEFKGTASYHDVVVGERVVESAAWSYRRPNDRYSELRDHVAFYAGRVDEAYLDDEAVTPQPGEFYGGWITEELDGPFKGGPGSAGW
jgi:uncharacterized protein (DUF427 family)